MNEAENFAEKYFLRKGYIPEKIINAKQSGMPDFKISENEYVEVKTVDSVYKITITENQIDKWSELLQNGKKVSLMVFGKEHKYITIFDIILKQKESRV